MSSEIGIEASGLGKRFELFRHPGQRLAGQFLPLSGSAHHWALRHVDLHVRRGTCLGVVGRNGSGKSTLLGLISGIVKPSTGGLGVNGKVAALLELGAGFHPDFTGRQNTFLAASIYGLSDSETRRRLPQIQEFAGIGDFFDRPVREFSSGMYARLAFAVAAHTDADILVIDEILGVGDAQFQRRCASFVREFRSRGVVLLVSHSEHTILSLCNAAIWLEGGRICESGSPRRVMHAYHAATAGGSNGRPKPTGRLALGTEWPVPERPSPQQAENGFHFDDLPHPAGGQIERVSFLSAGRNLEHASGGEAVTLEVTCSASVAMGRPVVGFTLRDSYGQIVVGADSSEFPDSRQPAGVDELRASFSFRLPYLPSGTYTLEVALVDLGGTAPVCLARQHDAGSLQVLSHHISSGMANVALKAARLVRSEIVPA